jgi:hypothetical protein
MNASKSFFIFLIKNTHTHPPKGVRKAHTPTIKYTKQSQIKELGARDSNHLLNKR